MRALSVTLLALAIGACPPAPSSSDAGPASAPVTLTGISPRSLSNQTANPLLLFGRGFAAGQRVRLGVPFGLDVTIVVDDAEHAAAKLPASLALGPDVVEVRTTVTLIDQNGAALGDPLDVVVVNDTGFVDVVAMVASPDVRYAFAASLSTDELFVLDTTSGAVERIPVGDGPWALAIYRSDVVVAHRYSRELRMVAIEPGADGKRASRTIAAPDHAHALAVDDAGVAYVGEHARDQLVAIELATGTEKWRADIAPNPRGIAIAGDVVAVGSLVAGETTLVDRKTGAVLSSGVAPRPGVPILGGHTEPYAKYVVGGKGVRALATFGGALLVASSGPNVGPNPDQMGVTGTGGVGVVDVAGRSYTRHLAFNFGIPQALAVDSARGRVYVADVGEGLVHVVDAKALIGKNEAKARAAWLGSVALPPPAGFPFFRNAEDFGVEAVADIGSESKPLELGENKKKRAGTEVHTGPSALALSSDGKALLVLERFSGRITKLDVSGAGAVEKSWVLFDALVQRDRRLGQVMYFADLGRTGMSCDGCHLEGHTEGVFFTKTGMMRIWKSSTVRGVRDTPPYFNPPGHATLEDTCGYVGSRNRFQNPPLNDEEVRLLTVFTKTYVTLPNPFRDDDGSFADAVALDGGRTGNPAKGRALFEAKCAGCHPAPLFSTDQDEKTRRKFMKVGTPPALEIRVEQQDLSFHHRTPPSLVGAWDNWPMLLTASAGFQVSKEGPFLEAKDHSALRAVLERYSPSSHGNAGALDAQKRADLEAFVQSL